MMDFSPLDLELDAMNHGLYEDMYQYPQDDSSNISSPHLSSRSTSQSLELNDFEFTYAVSPPYDFLNSSYSLEGPSCDPLYLEPLTTIDPQVLHAPATIPVDSPTEDALYEYAPPTPELVLTPQPPSPESPAPMTVAIPDNLDEYLIPVVDPIPMKKDRQRGSANLLRSARDPERQHQCTMCIRKFKRRADLARHIKRHQGIRPYVCVAQSCPLAPTERSFFRADARQRHWKANPQCEMEFYMTEAGREWMKRNRNRSQKFRSLHRRQTSCTTSNESYEDEDDDADYHE